MARRFVRISCNDCCVHQIFSLSRIVVFVLIICAVGSAFSVRPCIRSVDNAPGFCLPLSECSNFPPDGASKKFRPDLCEPIQQMPTVCCVAKKSSSPELQVTVLSLNSLIRAGNGTEEESISRQKCREYAQMVYEDDEKGFRRNSFQCVESFHRSGRALYGEFPHMVAVGYEPKNEDTIKFMCGGTLISERYVITAGHCIHGSPIYGRPRWALLGTLFTNLNLTDYDRQLIRVSQLIAHPDYMWGRYYFDIGLLQLTSNARLGPYVRPACLPSGRSTSSLELVATGWGSPAIGEKLSPVLLKVTLLEVPFEVCDDAYGSQQVFDLGVDNASTICIGRPGSSADTCQGDSGGPVQVISPDFPCVYEIVGVVSFGRSCGQGFPTACSRVEYFRRWIEDVVWG